MHLLNAEKVEDCFDGSSVFMFFFDEPWTEKMIEKLKTLGELDFFSDFPRPFFRLRATTGLQLKGVQGDNSCRVIFPSRNRDDVREKLEFFFRKDFTSS
ncbi:MAG: hypothetical protein HQM08_02440 [Candidatus Riflebacteria bacterium]|nr:hypothetical protein [Candidatus Riflebacteria bacterium]